MSTEIKVTISVTKVISAINKKYVQGFGEMDDRAYFMSGFVSTVLKELAEVENNEPDRSEKWLDIGPGLSNKDNENKS